MVGTKTNPKYWTWYDGRWIDGNPPLIGPQSHAFWLGTSVFDGARAFEGVAPDLDRHCHRVNASALAVGLQPTLRGEEIIELAEEGRKLFARDAALYIRPSYWGELDDPTLVIGALPSSTRFALTLWEAPMHEPTGISVTLSRFRRPTIECMPTNAKAGCLYPNNARAAREARAKGFDNAMVLDMLGNVAELASANVFMVKDGVAMTPAANGTYLAGITRARVLDLLRKAGTPVVEKTLRYEDFLDADEMFTTGNYTKVMPVVRFEDRVLEPGPIYRLARRLYWDFAHAG
jgi:branched-chain amino acid aminotransferase